MNNRKRTKGRRIQEIEVQLMVTKWVRGNPVLGPNTHPSAGNKIFVKHLPTQTPPPKRPF